LERNSLLFFGLLQRADRRQYCKVTASDCDGSANNWATSRPPAVARGLNLHLTLLQASVQDVPAHLAMRVGSAELEIQEVQDRDINRL
jgi:hypothetical protein